MGIDIRGIRGIISAMQTSNLQVRVSDSVKHAAQIKAAEMRVTLGQLVEMALVSMIGKKEPAK